MKRRGAKINITGCEDYENTFAGIESDCTLRFGFKVLIKSILYSLFETKDFSAGPERSSRVRSWNVWQLSRTVVYVLLHDCVNVRVCNLHCLHHTGHIGSYKLPALFIYDRWLLFLFNFPAGKHKLDSGVYFSAPILELFFFVT